MRSSLLFSIGVGGVAALMSAASSVGACPVPHGTIAPVTVAPVTVADSVPIVELTDDQVKHFLAMRTDLRAFWKDPKNAPLKKTAEATIQTFRVPGLAESASTYDYPRLAALDTAFAALFAKHHIAPTQFRVVQTGVMMALMSLALADAGMELPEKTTPAGKNCAVVKPHVKEFAALGMTFTAK